MIVFVSFALIDGDETGIEQWQEMAIVVISPRFVLYILFSFLMSTAILPLLVDI